MGFIILRDCLKRLCEASAWLMACVHTKNGGHCLMCYASDYVCDMCNCEDTRTY